MTEYERESLSYLKVIHSDIGWCALWLFLILCVSIAKGC